ncbi:MAG: PhoH family protein [Rhodospirillales bacterium]|nr:PhoH family protein [Rhodospirillales bacterium]MDP6642633.1 PhoH family protein [Rhodospirillales bacterium]MDP6840561.1 PhoH family protein [Rhodospirillales bacterium]
MNTPTAVREAESLLLEFDDNSLLPLLFGSHNSHLAQIEQRLDVTLNSRGNEVVISGPKEPAQTAAAVLTDLYQRLKDGQDVDPADIDGAIRMISANAGEDLKADDLAVRTRKRRIAPRSPQQANYLRAIGENDLVFGLGPAGTGKTYLAVAKAVESLIKGEIDRIILSRPAVEAGEQLGFLPGDMREKVDPYLRPLYDALNDMLPANQVAKKMESGEIEIAPLAFMRGRTLSDAFVILDEAQNTTPVQMKMFLTRLGAQARMVVTGDLSQIDLPRGVRSGLTDAVSILADVEGVSFVEFTDADVVRHRLVARIVRAYDRRAAADRERG